MLFERQATFASDNFVSGAHVIAGLALFLLRKDDSFAATAGQKLSRCWEMPSAIIPSTTLLRRPASIGYLASGPRGLRLLAQVPQFRDVRVAGSIHRLQRLI